MRPLILAIVAAGLFAAPVAGQDPMPLVEPLRTPPPTPMVYPDDGLFPPQESATPCPCPWHFDLIVGLPIALRLQRRFGESGWVEGGVSLYGPVPGIFAGLRADTRLIEGRRNLILVRPGVDAYYSPIQDSGGWFFPEVNGIGAVVGDFEFVWHHHWSDRFQGTFGLKLGCGIGIISGGVFPVPILGLVVGGQF
jgi:hypothetical protein